MVCMDSLEMTKLQIELNKQSIEVLKEGQNRQEGLLKDIQKSNVTMFNHFTEKYEKIFTELKERLPKWAVWALTSFAAIIGALLNALF